MSKEKSKSSYQLKKKVALNAFKIVGYIFARLLKATIRFKYVNIEHLEKAKAFHPKKAYALACWHEFSLIGIQAFTKENICILISPSFDGEITAHISKKLGYHAVRGSSNKGGRTAREQYIEHAKNDGFSIAITVDGPTGPKHKVKPGIVDFARKCNIPIIPFSAYAEKCIRLRSWDQLIIPKPFSTVYITFAPPILVDKDISREEFQKTQEKVEHKMKELDLSTFKKFQKV